MFFGGVGCIVVGALLMIFFRPIGRFFEWFVERFLPPALAQLVSEAPMGLDMQKRNLVVGGIFVIFGCVYTWATLTLT